MVVRLGVHADNAEGLLKGSIKGSARGVSIVVLNPAKRSAVLAASLLQQGSIQTNSARCMIRVPNCTASGPFPISSCSQCLLAPFAFAATTTLPPCQSLLLLAPPSSQPFCCPTPKGRIAHLMGPPLPCLPAAPPASPFFTPPFSSRPYCCTPPPTAALPPSGPDRVPDGT